MNKTELKNKLAWLKAEIEAAEKALAQAESHYPEKGTKGAFLLGNGCISERGFDDDDIDRAFYDRGRWFATREQAKLKDAYDIAATRINRAILAGERGDFVPRWTCGRRKWVPTVGTDGIFAPGSRDSIYVILRSRAVDFEAVRKYIVGVLGGGV